MSSEDQDRVLESVGFSPIAMVVTNPRLPDNPIELVNQAFCSLTGYSESEVVGRNCRFLAGERTEPWVTETIRQSIRERRAVLVEIMNYKRDGSTFRNGVMITPLFDDAGALEWFLGSQVDLGPGDDGAFALRRTRARGAVDSLARRQREVLAGMANGLLNKQIAYELGIAEKTVKMHRALLLERLGVQTTAEAIRIAVEAGL